MRLLYNIKFVTGKNHHQLVKHTIVLWVVVLVVSIIELISISTFFHTVFHRDLQWKQLLKSVRIPFVKYFYFLPQAPSMEITPEIIQNTICKILSVTFSEVDVSDTIIHLPQVASSLADLKENLVVINYQVV